MYFSTAESTSSNVGKYLSIVDGNVVSVGKKQNSQSYIRFNPSADGTTSYVGKMIFSFDVTLAGDATAQFDADYFIVANGKDIDRKTEKVTLVGGKTYRFTFEVEIKALDGDACEFIQFSLKNKTDNAAYQLTFSNVSFKFNSGTAENKESITAKAFAAIVKEEAKPEAQA